jgi:hypothetical protein
MLSKRPRRAAALGLVILAIVVLCARRSQAQAALLLEEPYGFFGAVNPTGHTAIYFARICAETPVKLRRCGPGEQGTIISRYQGIAGYDWVAIPPLPYFYSVEGLADVPARVDKATVRRLRNHYHEEHLGYLGEGVFEGSLVRGGWTQLVGVAFERRTFAFHFATTEKQDDAIIARLNSRPNRSNFNLVYNNCADFARVVLNVYFPRMFRRNFFPDAGMTTPKQITYKLTHYGRKHPEIHLTVFEIPQISGYRRISRSNKSVSASLMTTGYAVPIFLMNPYLAGGLFLDYFTRGRFPSVPEHPPVLLPNELSTLQSTMGGVQKEASPAASEQHTTAAVEGDPTPASPLAGSTMKEIDTGHEQNRHPESEEPRSP